jgi:hypothetical protein
MSTGRQIFWWFLGVSRSDEFLRALPLVELDQLIDDLTPHRRRMITFLDWCLDLFIHSRSRNLRTTAQVP